MLLGDRRPLLGDVHTLRGHSRALLGDGHTLLGDGHVLLDNGRLPLGDLHLPLGDGRLPLGDGRALLGDGPQLLCSLEPRQQLTLLDPQVRDLCSRGRQGVLQRIQVRLQLGDRVRRHLHLCEPAHRSRWDEKGLGVEPAPYGPRRELPLLFAVLDVGGIPSLPPPIERGHLRSADHTAQQ